MENKTEKRLHETFSQILFDAKLPSIEEIKSFNFQGHNQGIGPFIGNGSSYMYDLRSINEKGSLGHLHPLHIKHTLFSIAHNSTSLKPLKLDHLNYNFLSFLNSIGELSITNSISPSALEYNYKDYIDQKTVKHNEIVLNDSLFTSEINLFNEDILNHISFNTLWINLGIGLYLQVGNTPPPPLYFSPYHVDIINPFLNFIDTILINNGNGRIKTINAVLNKKLLAHGTNIILVNAKNIDNKPILKSNEFVLNVPTNITDHFLNHLAQVINE